MLKKQDIGINPHVANKDSRDQSVTGIGGPRVTHEYEAEYPETLGLYSAVQSCTVSQYQYPSEYKQNFKLGSLDDFYILLISPSSGNVFL